jgi:iron complex outermembrane receptor protein
METYGEETSWNYEIGTKTTWLEDSLMFNMTLFHIAWDNLQLNLPLSQTYYIANKGDAKSTGVEIELYARPTGNWDIFGSIGYDRARFGDGTTSIHTAPDGTNTEVDVGGNDLIYTPEYTASVGTQYSWATGPDSRIFIRAEATGYSSYFYNTANTESQDSYWLADFRAGYRTSGWFAEVWVNNAFDKKYIPVAFEFPNGQSGFIGENGAPRMTGLRVGFNF